MTVSEWAARASRYSFCASVRASLTSAKTLRPCHNSP
jgi:hypothetical protein